MKKIINKKPFSILVIMIFLMSIGIIIQSCQNELELNDTENQSINETDKTIVNNRFVFSSKQSLSDMIEDLKEQKIEIVGEKFEKLYEKGFRSQTPIINPENEKLIAKLSNERTESLKSRGLVAKENAEEEKLIADPFLASIVNEDNEIIVNDTLYKFSKEEGLLFVHVKDSTSLYNYFKEQNQTFSKSSLSYRVDPCEERMQRGGVTRLNDRVSRYIRPIDECGSGGSGGDGSGNGGSGSSNHTDPEVTVNNLIQNLEICEGSTSWFQSLFGTYRYCHKYFNNSNRMQIEFWDQRWFIYKSVGVNVQAHKRGWFWWYNKKADELRLGINKIYLKYKYTEPQIQYFNPNAITSTPIYMHNGQFFIKNNNSIYNPLSIKTLNNTNLPFFNFEQGDILNIYIPNLPFVGDFELNFSTEDLVSQSNIKKLYQEGINFLKKQFPNSKKEFVVTYQKNDKEIEVIYFGERYKAYNSSQIKRRFYKDWSFVAGAGYSDQVAGQGFKSSYSFKAAPEFFRTYTYYQLDFYGLVRKGSTWKGVRMVRN